MIQVVLASSTCGRRVFLMAPIHHHFEMKAWSETKIMVRFWIVAGILCAAGFALYYRYYFGQEMSGWADWLVANGRADEEAVAQAERVLEAAALRPGDTVLDVGARLGCSRWPRTSGSATAG